jgi:hypothetical protein
LVLSPERAQSDAVLAGEIDYPLGVQVYVDLLWALNPFEA